MREYKIGDYVRIKSSINGGAYTKLGLGQIISLNTIAEYKFCIQFKIAIPNAGDAFGFNEDEILDSRLNKPEYFDEI